MDLKNEKMDIDVLKVQYDLVKQSRQVLFDYCYTIKENDLLHESPDFGRGGSIRNLLVHNANTYAFWIEKWCLQKEVEFTIYESIENINQVVQLFEHTNQSMLNFIEKFANQNHVLIDIEINDLKKSVHFFQIFTHVITHEFHHKGQILSMSRRLGYIPVDTDIMR